MMQVSSARLHYTFRWSQTHSARAQIFLWLVNCSFTRFGEHYKSDVRGVCVLNVSKRECIKLYPEQLGVRVVLG